MRGLRTAVVVLAGMFSVSTLFADARSDAKSQVTFGIKVAQHGLWREAMYRFERAVEIDPTYAPAWNNLAIACEEQGHMDRAKEAYEKALALSPKDTYIRQNYELFLEIHARATRRSAR